LYLAASGVILSQFAVPTLPLLARYAELALISGYVLVVGWKLVNGAIATDGLLRSSDGRQSPGRQQLLLFTIVAAAQYLAAVWKNPGAQSLPAPPQGMLAILAGSQAVYLGGKAISTWLPLVRKSR
jgi:hypothetical protein